MTVLHFCVFLSITKPYNKASGGEFRVKHCRALLNASNWIANFDRNIILEQGLTDAIFKVFEVELKADDDEVI